MGFVDDWRAIHRHVHDPAPHAQQPRAAKRREDRHATFADVFDGGQIAALGVGIIPVDIATKNQPALVRLAAIEMPCAECHDTGHHRLQSFGDEGLQDMGLHRQAHLGLRHQAARGARDSASDLACTDEPARCLHTKACAILNAKTRYFAILDNIHAPAIRTACVTPCNGIMPHGAATMLGQPTLDWKARVFGIQIGVALFDLARREHG